MKIPETDKDSPSRELKGEWKNAKVRVLEDGKKVIYVGDRFFPAEEARESLTHLVLGQQEEGYNKRTEGWVACQTIDQRKCNHNCNYP